MKISFGIASKICVHLQRVLLNLLFDVIEVLVTQLVFDLLDVLDFLVAKLFDHFE